MLEENIGSGQGHGASLGIVSDGWSMKSSGDCLVRCGLFSGSLGVLL